MAGKFYTASCKTFLNKDLRQLTFPWQVPAPIAPPVLGDWQPWMAAGPGRIAQFPLESRKDADPSSFVVSLADGAASMLRVDRRLTASRGSGLNPGGMHTRQFAGDDARPVSGHAPSFRRAAAARALGAAAAAVQGTGQPVSYPVAAHCQRACTPNGPAQIGRPWRHA